MSETDTSREMGSQVTSAGNAIMVGGGVFIFALGAANSGGGNGEAASRFFGTGIAIIGAGLTLTGIGSLMTRKGVFGDMYTRANVDSSGRILLGTSLFGIPLTVALVSDPTIRRAGLIVGSGLGAAGSVLLGSAQDIGGIINWDKMNQA
jgi:hypothetical protein